MQNNTVDREEWIRQRAELLTLEKAHTKERDRLSELRRQLPWVKVGKNYRFELGEAEVSLADLFGDHSQLIVYHLMFGENSEISLRAPLSLFTLCLCLLNICISINL